ncbi:copper amine oxidase N-terminal domain-containing protein [Paenibacillus sp. WQ 127069]|uniref:Copper amine oxidase N-terminal domain-containing protein n=1 Tax=Paenibacillus baimaensis TaxID=2982185 RepID=A0ABT2UD43_9BACL|nr:copper amine oxidase N-terminal domain-containing protein [Paenibacillus sp. WQ 127069]MCU6792568.1 copper amine oxidase N-terminal domain-containing protein [Paenibacillus sp. WQ 127069]
MSIIIIFFLLLVTFNTLNVFAEDVELNYQLFINGESFESELIVDNNAVYAPLWGIMSKLGVSMDQDEYNKTFRINLPDKVLTFISDSNIVYQMDITASNYNKYKFGVNSTRMEVPFITKNDVVYTPLVFLSQYLDAIVLWNDQTINVSANDYDIGDKWTKLGYELGYSDLSYFWGRVIGSEVDKIRDKLEEEANAENYWIEHSTLYLNKSDHSWGSSHDQLEEVIIIAYDGLSVTLSNSKGQFTETFADFTKLRLAFFTEDPLSNPGWSNTIKQQIRNREISIGMNEDMVWYSWGTPYEKKSYSSNYGSTVQWIYKKSTYSFSFVYFKNGKVTSIQN